MPCTCGGGGTHGVVEWRIVRSLLERCGGLLGSFRHAKAEGGEEAKNACGDETRREVRGRVTRVTWRVWFEQGDGAM